MPWQGPAAGPLEGAFASSLPERCTLCRRTHLKTPYSVVLDLSRPCCRAGGMSGRDTVPLPDGRYRRQVRLPVLHCAVLHCTALHCTALHCTAHCTALLRSAQVLIQYGRYVGSDDGLSAFTAELMAHRWQAQVRGT